MRTAPRWRWMATARAGGLAWLAGLLMAGALPVVAAVPAVPAGPSPLSTLPAAPSPDLRPGTDLVTGPVTRADLIVTDDQGQRLRLARPPQRIVSLLPSLTEMVCALGACSRLVGTDRYSNWPAVARALPKLGGLDDAQFERIVTLRPDLVLTAASGRVNPRLAALGIPVLALEPKTLADTRRVLETVAQVLGSPGAGLALWHTLDRQLDAAARRVPVALRGQRVYFEVASTPYAAGPHSFVGEVLARLGLGNAVPAEMGPFPQLNPEFVLRVQPDLVMAAARALAQMAQRPGWASLTALQRHRTCAFAEPEYDMLVRPGPRLAEAAHRLVDCLVALDGPAAGASR